MMFFIIFLFLICTLLWLYFIHLHICMFYFVIFCMCIFGHIAFHSILKNWVCAHANLKLVIVFYIQYTHIWVVDIYTAHFLMNLPYIAVEKITGPLQNYFQFSEFTVYTVGMHFRYAFITKRCNLTQS